MVFYGRRGIRPRPRLFSRAGSIFLPEKAYTCRMSIRDRYAPSPTGLQHVGGLRTALFNYLLARSRGGAFVLRLEDTDRARSDESFAQNLYDTFRWLGVRWDEGPDVGGAFAPYVQSERAESYAARARELLEGGHAYRCFCTAERIDLVRREREAAKSPEAGYDRHCRGIPEGEAGRRAEAGERHTVRLKIPLGETTRLRDRLLGEIEWKNDDLSPDPVLVKSDGFPTYHLANVADDRAMGITHVLRAQEWLSSAPLHAILYRAFGWEPPEFCHLPLVTGQDGKKLSKRHGATSIDEFRRQGYLPEALLNYVALLGASYEEGRDVYSLGELERLFSLDKLSKSPAIFDYKKLEWLNGQHIRAKADAELAELCLPAAAAAGLFGEPGAGPDAGQRSLFAAAMPLIRERISFPGEAAGKIAYLFREPELPAPEEFIPKKSSRGEAARLLRVGAELARPAAQAGGDAEAEALFKSAAEKSGAKLGDLLAPLRVAVTGSRVSPPLFGSLRLLGADRSLERIARALALLEG